MIVLDIDDEQGASHFEVLGISNADLNGLDDKALMKKVNDAAKVMRKPHQNKAQLNDKGAEHMLQRINQAASILKDKVARKKYLEELEQGKSGTLAVLRVERIAPAFFWDRAARFRAIAQALQETRT